jgi:phosphohistidine phosphatase SixA
MYKCLLILTAAFLLTACSHTYYVVRHAEKETATGSMNSTDPPLTEFGKRRAGALKEILANKKIRHIYSTNTIRTKSTAQPVSDWFKIPIVEYGPRPDSMFIKMVKSKKENVLIVGHSNTVDDIVNGLMGRKVIPKDLDDSEYDHLFVVKRKRKKVVFEDAKIVVSH